MLSGEEWGVRPAVTSDLPSSLGAPGPSSAFPGALRSLLEAPGAGATPLPASAFPPGLVSSAKASIAYLLSRPGGGQVAVLAVGGPLEALEAKPGALSLRIRNQKGFVKLALEHGWVRRPGRGRSEPLPRAGGGALRPPDGTQAPSLPQGLSSSRLLFWGERRLPAGPEPPGFVVADGSGGAAASPEVVPAAVPRPPGPPALPQSHLHRR